MVCDPAAAGRDVIAKKIAAVLLCLPMLARADATPVVDSEVKFPKCEIEVDTAFGSAKVLRALSKGRYLYQFVFWDAARNALEPPLKMSLRWRKTRSSGISNGPILSVGMGKESSSKDRRFAWGSMLTVTPAVASAIDAGSLRFGPLTSGRAKYRKNFEVDVVYLLEKFKGQESVNIQIAEPKVSVSSDGSGHDKSKHEEMRIVGESKLSMNFVRAFAQIDWEANPILDKWQRAGGVGCPGQGQ